MTPRRVLVLVSDTALGAIGLRATELSRRLSTDRFTTRVVYRQRRNLPAVPVFLKALMRERPALVYLLNISLAGAVAGLLAKQAARRRLIVEVGDPLVEHFKNAGHPAIVCAAVGAVERLVLSVADEVVVRGAWLGEYFSRRGPFRAYHWLPDGVDLDVFRPMPVDDAKRACGVSGKYVIGTVGRLTWTAAHAIGYGWDIVEALADIDDEDVVGLIVGDGEGVAHLKRRAAERKISHRVHFPGWVPHTQVPCYVNAMDVCVSTQTNDPVGWSRTTAKLPEFMACGRTVLATEVGEAAALLKGTGQLLPYEGLRDDSHPRRLARRIRQIRGGDVTIRAGEQNRAAAERLFDYDVLAERLGALLDDVLGRDGRARPRARRPARTPNGRSS